MWVLLEENYSIILEIHRRHTFYAKIVFIKETHLQKRIIIFGDTHIFATQLISMLRKTYLLSEPNL